MYSRTPNYRYPGGMRLPDNYGGNTFREQAKEIGEARCEEDTQKKEESDEQLDNVQPTAILPKAGFKLRLGSLFGGNKGIGSEELLILALVLLLADTEGNDDLILFLILLFFIK